MKTDNDNKTLYKKSKKNKKSKSGSFKFKKNNLFYYCFTNIFSYKN